MICILNEGEDLFKYVSAYACARTAKSVSIGLSCILLPLLLLKHPGVAVYFFFLIIKHVKRFFFRVTVFLS